MQEEPLNCHQLFFQSAVLSSISSKNLWLVFSLNQDTGTGNIEKTKFSLVSFGTSSLVTRRLGAFGGALLSRGALLSCGTLLSRGALLTRRTNDSAPSAPRRAPSARNLEKKLQLADRVESAFLWNKALLWNKAFLWNKAGPPTVR